MKKTHMLNNIVILLLSFVISVISICYAQKGYNYSWYLCFIKAGFMLPYLQLGFIYKKYESFFNKNKAYQMVVFFIIMYILYVIEGENGVNVTVVAGKFVGSPMIITVLTCVGILLTATVSEFLTPAFLENKVVNNIGNNTFSIMMHHGFVIFIINFLIYLLNKVIEIPSFDVSKFKSTLWYVYPWKDARGYLLYVVLGIAIPLMVKHYFDEFILLLWNKYNKNEEFDC